MCAQFHQPGLQPGPARLPCRLHRTQAIELGVQGGVGPRFQQKMRNGFLPGEDGRHQGCGQKFRMGVVDVDAPGDVVLDQSEIALFSGRKHFFPVSARHRFSL